MSALQEKRRMPPNLHEAINGGEWHEATHLYASLLAHLWEGGDMTEGYWIEHLIYYECAHGLRTPISERPPMRSDIRGLWPVVTDP